MSIQFHIYSVCKVSIQCYLTKSNCSTIGFCRTNNQNRFGISHTRFNSISMFRISNTRSNVFLIEIDHIQKNLCFGISNHHIKDRFILKILFLLRDIDIQHTGTELKSDHQFAFIVLDFDSGIISILIEFLTIPRISISIVVIRSIVIGSTVVS